MATQIVFVFVPVEKTGDGFAEQLRECLTSLGPQPSHPAAEVAEAKAEPAPAAPLWTWFMPNPRPSRKI